MRRARTDLARRVVACLASVCLLFVSFQILTFHLHAGHTSERCCPTCNLARAIQAAISQAVLGAVGGWIPVAPVVVAAETAIGRSGSVPGFARPPPRS